MHVPSALTVDSLHMGVCEQRAMNHTTLLEYPSTTPTLRGNRCQVIQGRFGTSHGLRELELSRGCVSRIDISTPCQGGRGIRRSDRVGTLDWLSSEAELDRLTSSLKQRGQHISRHHQHHHSTYPPYLQALHRMQYHPAFHIQHLPVHRLRNTLSPPSALTAATVSYTTTVDSSRPAYPSRLNLCPFPSIVRRIGHVDQNLTSSPHRAFHYPSNLGSRVSRTQTCSQTACGVLAWWIVPESAPNTTPSFASITALKPCTYLQCPLHAPQRPPISHTQRRPRRLYHLRKSIFVTTGSARVPCLLWWVHATSPLHQAQPLHSRTGDYLAAHPDLIVSSPYAASEADLRTATLLSLHWLASPLCRHGSPYLPAFSDRQMTDNIHVQRGRPTHRKGSWFPKPLLSLYRNTPTLAFSA